MNQAAFDRLLTDPPKLHTLADYPPVVLPSGYDQGAELVCWGVQPSFCRLLVELVTPGHLTLEIGSGLSTICFALIGSEHICVSPSPQEHDRIRRYCREHGISTERVRFIPMKSHAVLPSLDTGGRKLDFALIDGAHTFPEPIVDFYFINEHLKTGGVLALDDLDISAVGILHKFLVTEPAYELIKIDGTKTGIYRKVGDTHRLAWCSQGINRTYPDVSYLPLMPRIRERLRLSLANTGERLRSSVVDAGVSLRGMGGKIRARLGRLPGARGARRLFRSCPRGL